MADDRHRIGLVIVQGPPGVDGKDAEGNVTFAGINGNPSENEALAQHIGEVVNSHVNAETLQPYLAEYMDENWKALVNSYLQTYMNEHLEQMVHSYLETYMGAYFNNVDDAPL